MASNLRGLNRIDLLISRYREGKIKEEVFLRKFYGMLLEIIFELSEFYRGVPYMKNLIFQLNKLIIKHRNMILRKDSREFEKFLKDIQKLKKKLRGNKSALETLDEIINIILDKLQCSIYVEYPQSLKGRFSGKF